MKPCITSGQQPRAGKPGQAGFTLIEVMISMVIGLFIVLALITLLVNVNRNNSEMGKTNRVIENGRFALQLLQADIVHAGFWAGYVPEFDDLTRATPPTDVPPATVTGASLPDPCQALATWDATYRSNITGITVQAYEIPATVPNPTVPVCSSIVVNPQPNTDVLMVRHLEPCAAGIDTGCAAVTAADVYFRTQRCTTATSPNISSTTFSLGTSATTSLTPVYRRDCLTLADPYKFASDIYYVRNFAVTAGDGIPTLMRSQFTAGAQQPAQALIEGIEGFRVQLGVDNVSDSGVTLGTPSFWATVNWADPNNMVVAQNRGDGLPDVYVRCTSGTPCTAFQLMNTVAIKMYVLVRSENRSAGYTDAKTYTLGGTTLGPFNDGYKRHLFTQTVRMTNVSGRRETPTS
jgi:type IV pilus assembly protein PilW